MDLTEMRARISMVNQCVEYECSLEAAKAILCPILVEAGEAMAETLCGMSLLLALSFGQILQLQLSPSVQACFDKLVERMGTRTGSDRRRIAKILPPTMDQSGVTWPGRMGGVTRPILVPGMPEEPTLRKSHT